MKDFLKIFFVLIAIVIAFITGRNYGETSVVESKEYKDTKSQIVDNANSNSELALMKEKIQSLLDSSDLKKADEVYGKMMTLFLVDLGLRISEQQQKDMDVGKSQLLVCASQSGQKPVVKTPEAPVQQMSIPAKEPQEPKEPKFTQNPIGKYKSSEWTLVNSSSNAEIVKSLEKLKLTSVDAYLQNSPETRYGDLQKYFGTFRGRVSAVDGSNFGSLILNIGPSSEKEKQVAGKVELYREGKVQSTSTFSGDTWGNTPTGFMGTMVEMGKRFLQIYKIESADKIAGNFYERLPNGTTKHIGYFVLSRTDRF